MNAQSMILAQLGQMGIQIERVSSEAMNGIAKDIAEMTDSGLDFGDKDQIKELEKVMLWHMHKHPV